MLSEGLETHFLLLLLIVLVKLPFVLKAKPASLETKQHKNLMLLGQLQSGPSIIKYKNRHNFKLFFTLVRAAFFS